MRLLLLQMLITVVIIIIMMAILIIVIVIMIGVVIIMMIIMITLILIILRMIITIILITVFKKNSNCNKIDVMISNSYDENDSNNIYNENIYFR